MRSIARTSALACLSVLLAPAFAAAQAVDGDAASLSSSNPTLAAPRTVSDRPLLTPGVQDLVSTRPFSAVALGVKVGVAGIGVEVATPLARRINLRGSASFFSYSPNLTEDGEVITGTLSFKTVNTSVDFYPFANAFRISPGVTLYNGNHLTATSAVAAGQTFTLNGTTYYSSTANPVTGIFDVSLGNKVAPSITIGFGNMIPHHAGQHWSVPFEIGGQYINTTQITINLTGSACTNSPTSGCSPIATSPAIQANVAGEQATLNSDISPLRFYPILSIGVSYKFGNGR